MGTKNLYRLSQAISEARRVRGTPQKVLALSVGIDGPRLSAIERGRATGTGDELVQRICVAMRLRESERNALLGAAAHDRTMREVSKNYPPECQDFLALCLDAARLLEPADRSRLVGLIEDLVALRQRLAAFEQEREASMP